MEPGLDVTAAGQPDNETLCGNDLACIRGQRVVFSGLSFALPPGSVTVLRGPNGAGKSTLLRLAAGLLKPATGTLRWGAQDIEADREGHRRRIRYVGHLDAVKPVLSVGENLSMWAALYGARPQAQDIAGALAAFDLAGLAALPARFLSAGQRRRLNLARLPVAPGRLWLLDEPTVSLDSASVGLLEAAIRQHVAGGGSVLVATHSDLDVGATAHMTLQAAHREPADA